jgi:hypothetical protein
MAYLAYNLLAWRMVQVLVQVFFLLAGMAFALLA